MTQLTNGTRLALSRYVAGALSRDELAEWLTQAEYDEDLPVEERDELARIGLVVVEVAEGARPTEQILTSVESLLAKTAEHSRR